MTLSASSAPSRCSTRLGGGHDGPRVDNDQIVWKESGKSIDSVGLLAIPIFSFWPANDRRQGLAGCFDDRATVVQINE